MFKGKNILNEAFIRSRIIVNPLRGCWEWQAYRQSSGYGQFRLNNRSMLAHRASWEIANKKQIPNGLCVLHRCDNRCCVNPTHLFLGTIQDNARDCWDKGRSNYQKTGFACTRINRKRKLTDQQTGEIRATRYNMEPLADIAKRYGVSMACVSMIRRGKRKKLVP